MSLIELGWVGVERERERDMQPSNIVIEAPHISSSRNVFSA
jgi:hypothetical protein